MRDKAWEIERCHPRPLPTIEAKPRNRVGSSGTTYDTDGPDPLKIIVRLGSDLVQQRVIVVHELTHAITRHGHTLKFWTTAWRLFEHFGLTAYRDTFISEFRYKAGAIDGAFAAGVEIPAGVIRDSRPKWRHDHMWRHDAKASTEQRSIYRCVCKSVFVEVLDGQGFAWSEINIEDQAAGRSQ